jgi:hypothetical protein
MINVIHNTYEKNRYLRESAISNIKALKDTKLEFNYIIFNDHGDESIYEDVKDLLEENVSYIYSDINYGMKVCSGGWVGAIPYLKEGLIHNIGQDDVYTTTFYTTLYERLQNPNIHLAYANGFKVNPNLTLQGQTLGPLQDVDYSNPKQHFNMWFGVQNNIITRANNFIPAPGVIYKTSVHDLIGPPDLETFKGSADFEYWARVLFHNLGVSYDPRPLWLYRMSEYSLGSKPLAERETPNWNNLIIEKYQKWLTQS